MESNRLPVETGDFARGVLAMVDVALFDCHSNVRACSVSGIEGPSSGLFAGASIRLATPLCFSVNFGAIGAARTIGEGKYHRGV